MVPIQILDENNDVETERYDDRADLRIVSQVRLLDAINEPLTERKVRCISLLVSSEIESQSSFAPHGFRACSKKC